MVIFSENKRNRFFRSGFFGNSLVIIVNQSPSFVKGPFLLFFFCQK
jgi:hypothetical protein